MALFATGALYNLSVRKYALDRACTAKQVTLILWGWALAQFPYIVEPDISLDPAAAPRTTLRLLIASLAAGVLLLFPSFYNLFRFFKGETAFAPLARETPMLQTPGPRQPRRKRQEARTSREPPSSFRCRRTQPWLRRSLVPPNPLHVFVKKCQETLGWTDKTLPLADQLFTSRAPEAASKYREPNKG